MQILKTLSKNLFLTGGRNNSGKIVSFHSGGGYKKRYRFIDFTLNHSTSLKVKENFYFKHGVVIDFFNDPIRKVPLALVRWLYVEPFNFCSRKYSYILKTAHLKKNNSIFFSNKNLAGVNLLYSSGSCLPLFEAVPGMFLSNVSGLYARSSGCFCELIRHDFKSGFSLLGLPSGKRF
jgi:large subunit ribosomal protein L2